jgi:cysteinyl-tRNA synthetase
MMIDVRELRIGRRCRLLRCIGALMATALAAAAALPAAAGGTTASRTGSQDPTADAASWLPRVRSWAYQMQNVDPAEVAASSHDLVVIDPTRNGDAAAPLRTEEVVRMKRKPGGGRRIVLAYVNVGEAEDHRAYWNESWIVTRGPGAAAASPPQPDAAASPLERWISDTAPPWLGDETGPGSGSFAVKYWDAGWQALIFGAPSSLVERALAQGFDGVFLDRVDAFHDHAAEHDAASESMVDLVVRLSVAARTAKPGAIVVPHNGEELLTRPTYLAAIDAVAKEDLLFGGTAAAVANPPEQIAESAGWLSLAAAAGRPVLVVEYLDEMQQASAAAADLLRRGFVPYFAPRELDRLLPPSAGSASPAGGASAIGAAPAR